MKNLRTCCFIDYYLFKNDENQIAFKYKLKEMAKSLIEDFYVTHFISGMGPGFEQLAAEIIFELKSEYSGITLEAVLPYENFSAGWNEEERDKYFFIMGKIDKETLLQYHYTKDCMRKRNIYMINKSHYVITLCNTKKPCNLTLYAKANKKTVFFIQPDNITPIPQIKIYR